MSPPRRTSSRGRVQRHTPYGRTGDSSIEEIGNSPRGRGIAFIRTFRRPFNYDPPPAYVESQMNNITITQPENDQVNTAPSSHTPPTITSSPENLSQTVGDSSSTILPPPP
ncbi:18330_t:CDS:2 [Dentiscutata erythropus]|uniref:18330_t:CDS:1 n=1 Tax=Dentiscutata erythropus TaxID=1348616 RepID=A0A9N9DYI0_9GLOM|nr:18330_t:CDS:2 [Dentiscutata erythropus]